MAVETVNWRRRHFPFNAEQTVNILGEIGPLFAMFLVNGIYGIAAGTWALIVCTMLSLVVTLWVLGRPPIMPFIAGAVSVTFGALTLITGDADVGADQGHACSTRWWRSCCGSACRTGQQLLPLRVRQDLPLHRGGLDTS